MDFTNNLNLILPILIEVSKIGTLIEKKVLNQMTPRSLQSGIVFKVKLKVIDYSVFDLHLIM